jgi:hypothetical protein
MNPIFETRVGEALAQLTPDLTPLRISKILRQSLPPELAQLASLLHELRIRCATRFPTLALPYLNRKGLEQASAESVARLRASHIASSLAGALLYDATCGVGADSCALADAGIRVVSGDLELENLEYTRANLLANNLNALVLQADALSASVKADVLLIDPDRRKGGMRTLDPTSWSPDLKSSLFLSKKFDGACLKLAPALSAEVLLAAESATLPPELPRRREWLSNRGELAELTLWTGSLAENDQAERRASRINSDGSLAHFSGSPREVEPLGTAEASEVAWIADPDPALLRSGLLGNLAVECDLAPLAPKIAYLGGDQNPRSPFLRAWRVRASCSLDRKKVRAMLGEHDVGPISVRKRGHSERTEVLERKFRGPGTQRGALLLVRLERGHRAFLVEAAGREGQESGGR